MSRVASVLWTLLGVCLGLAPLGKAAWLLSVGAGTSSFRVHPPVAGAPGLSHGQASQVPWGAASQSFGGQAEDWGAQAGGVVNREKTNEGVN